jgi:hypothetical protein
LRIVALSFLLVLLSCSTQAAETSLTVTVGGETRNFAREALLARSDAATISAFRRPRRHACVTSWSVAGLISVLGSMPCPSRFRARMAF